VKDPEKSFPPGIALAVLLVFLATFLPVLIGTGASDRPYSEWRDGYFISLAVQIAGPWLGYWMLLASSMSNVAMFEAEMSSDAWQVCGMAERGIIPKVFGERNKYGTPKYGVLVSLSGILVVTSLDFEKVIELLNMLFCFSQALEFTSFIELRRSYPNMHRPWKIPMGFTGICLMLSLPLSFTFVIMYFSSTRSLIASTSATIIGFIVYSLLEKAKEKRWCEFNKYVPFCSAPLPGYTEVNTDTEFSVNGSISMNSNSNSRDENKNNNNL